MKKIITLIILVALLGAMTVTCPSRDHHKDAVMDVVNSYVDNKVSGLVKNDKFGLAKIGTFFGSKLLDAALDSQLKYSNYFIFSKSELHFNGKTSTVGIGILNHVFTLNEEDIDEALVGLVRK